MEQQIMLEKRDLDNFSKLCLHIFETWKALELNSYKLLLQWSSLPFKQTFQTTPADMIDNLGRSFSLTPAVLDLSSSTPLEEDGLPEDK